MPSNNNQTTTEELQSTVSPVLHLTADNSDQVKKKKKKNEVRWKEGTIDNENLNKKKTKICCIFHPQRNFDDLIKDDNDSCSCESESESDSDSDSDSDTDDDKSNKDTAVPPNAYEIQPKYKK